MDLPLCLFYNGRVFFQLFTTLPLYITTKIWINGISKWAFIIRIADFLSEMPIVSFTQRKHKPTWIILFLADVLSFYVLLINIWAGILIVSILLSLF
jgi:hypothetical protein